MCVQDGECVRKFVLGCALLIIDLYHRTVPGHNQPRRNGSIDSCQIGHHPSVLCAAFGEIMLGGEQRDVHATILETIPWLCDVGLGHVYLSKWSIIIYYQIPKKIPELYTLREEQIIKLFF